MEDYIMTSIETDVQFVDNASDSHMSDEEREYWIDLEEGETEEEEEVLYEATEDTAINFAFDTLFGMSKEQSRKNRKAVKKAQLKSLPTMPKCEGVVSVHEENLTRLSNHFNRGIK